MFTGCGRQQAPSPPKTRPELINDTLNVLKHKEHDIALKKIERLRELEPTNVFLANLEILEKNNAIISHAQEEVNKFNLQKALDTINEGIKKYGRHKDLLKAQKKLAVAAKIESILNKFKQPKDSNHLRKAATVLKEISLKYPPAKPFTAVAEQQLKKSKRMKKWEEQEAVVYFYSYLDQCIDKKDTDLSILYAILEIIDPASRTLLIYKDHLNGNNELPLKTFIDLPDQIIEKTKQVKPFEFHLKQTDNNENNNENFDNDLNKKNISTEKKTKKKGWWNKFMN
jgi:hypothetical protein